MNKDKAIKTTWSTLFWFKKYFL